MNIKSTESNLKEHTATRIDLMFSAHGAVNRHLIQEIEDACDAVEDAGPNTVLVVRFSFNAPNDSTIPERPEVNVHLLSKWEKALRRLECLSAVTISLVDGPCFGYGLALMLTTDFRIASPQMELTAQDQQGAILPGMGLYRLTNQIGVAKARSLVLFGTKIGCAEALNLSLVNIVIDNLELAADDFISSLGKVDLSSLPIRRRLLLEAPTVSYEDALGVHLAACDRALRN